MKKLIFVFALSTATLGLSASSLKSVNVVAQEEATKKVEIETAKLSEKITANIATVNKENKISKAYQVVDNAGAILGYEVVVVNDKQEQLVYKFDKNGDVSTK